MSAQTDTDAPAPARRRRLLPPGSTAGWPAYAWLLYLSFFLIEPVVRLRLGTMTAAHAATTLLALAVFLVSYFRGFWVQGRGLLLVIAVQTALGVALVRQNPGASVFLIYAASFAGTDRRTGLAAGIIVAISGVGAATSLLVHAPPLYWVPAVLMPLVIGFVNVHYTQQARANASLRMAREQIQHLAAVAERERIGRDLHDVLGHTLSLIVLKSELAAKLATRDADRAAREIREVEQVARKALREVREAIRGYRASLADEVRQSEALLDAAGIRARMEVQPAELPREVEESLALALREAVTNVVRHSGAAWCAVRLRPDGGSYLLEVTDDGRAGEVTEGSGLRGMRERVAAAGGAVSVQSAAGGGMRIAVRVPLGGGQPVRGADVHAAVRR
ncbi:MAG TPA: sensor histidine kinase [Longimicrobium sp.]|uniref:sensor histidine kinase n=1 Tax=Longimicrobium sp. TaxID=2029185 RepID=UPI002EDA5061